MLNILALLACLLVPSLAQATVFFDSDFETCAASPGNDWPCEGWDDFGLEATCTTNRLQVVSGIAFTGSKSVKLTYNNVAGSTCRPSIFHNFQATNHIFLRAAIRQDAGFQHGSNGGSKRIRFRPANTGNDPNPSDGLGPYPVFWLYNYFGSWAVNIEGPCDNLPGGYWIVANTPTPSQFDQVELEIFMNTGGLSNGGLRIWVNGVLRAQSLNRKWVSATPNGTCPGQQALWRPSDWFTTGAQIYLQSGVGTLYYDRVAVGNERIGIVGSPPIQDTTNPTPPTNMTAQ